MCRACACLQYVVSRETPPAALTRLAGPTAPRDHASIAAEGGQPSWSPRPCEGEGCPFADIEAFCPRSRCPTMARTAPKLSSVPLAPGRNTLQNVRRYGL